nr:ornithine cyclodeaminase [Rhizobium sp. BK251]
MRTNEDVDFISARRLRELDAELTPSEVQAAVDVAWRDIRAGTAHGAKAVLSLAEAEFWARPEVATSREEFADERLGWKLSCLYSVNGRYGGVKIVGANAFNRRLGLPRSTSTVLLLDKFTLRPLVVLDGTSMSSARTGSYATLVIEQFLAGLEPLSIFVFGAGPVARSVIDNLACGHTHRIEEVFVRSRSYANAKALVGELENRLGFALRAVDDNTALSRCQFVITASNSRHPVFDDSELGAEAVTLHLGGDEVPEAYLQRALRTGIVGCDDLATVSRRNSQSLALHFSRKGLQLEEIGSLIGIQQLSSQMPWPARSDGPVSITCVGLPALDLYVAAATYEKYRRVCDGLREGPMREAGAASSDV